SAPDGHGNCRRSTSAAIDSTCGVGPQPLRAAQIAARSSTGLDWFEGSSSGVTAPVTRGPSVPEPSGVGNDATASPKPPSYGTNGSAVPGQATTGTGRTG